MKIHNFFISNSSSSSFIILGVYADDELLNKVGYDFDAGCCHGSQSLDNNLMAVGTYGYVDMIGRNIEKDLLADKKISEIKKLVEESFMEYEIDIPLNSIELAFGEWGE